jgi:hypothetical protein
MMLRTACRHCVTTDDVFNEIQEHWASPDGLLPHVDFSADNDMFAHLTDWSTLDAMFPVDLTFDKLDGLCQPIENPMGKRRLRRTGGKPPR